MNCYTKSLKIIHDKLSISIRNLSQKIINSDRLSTIYASIGCEISDPLTGAVTPPIHLSTTFERDQNTLELTNGYNYSRLSNPTRLLFEKAMCKIEFGLEGFAFSSGMQAITSLFLSYPKAHVLIPDDLYHGVYVVLNQILEEWGMTYEKIDMTNHDLIHDKLVQYKSNNSNNKLIVWLETPSNPQCKITDIKSISNIARSIINQNDLCIVVDSTWSTPYLLNPLTLGADIVMHSTTKYIGGHSDLLGGVLVVGDTIGGRSILPKLKTCHQIGGGVASPFDSWLALRGLRTLPVRMKQHSDNALIIAKQLNDHKDITKVYYPGLPSHPQHQLASQQMRLYGGMMSFLVNNDRSNGGSVEALNVVKNVKLFKRATSLGGTESLIEHRRTAEGLFAVSPPNLLRISVGLEDPYDLIDDLFEAISISK